jgi:hypothetical protein
VPGLRRYVQSHIVEERTRADIPTTDVDVDGARFIGRIKPFTVPREGDRPRAFRPDARRAAIWGILKRRN